MNNFHQNSALPQSCAEWEEKLATTPIAKLSPPEHEALSVHMESCKTCATLFQQYCVIDEYLSCTFAAQTFAAQTSHRFTPKLPLSSRLRFKAHHLCQHVRQWIEDNQPQAWVILGSVVLLCVGLVSAVSWFTAHWAYVTNFVQSQLTSINTLLLCLTIAFASAMMGYVLLTFRWNLLLSRIRRFLKGLHPRADATRDRRVLARSASIDSEADYQQFAERALPKPPLQISPHGASWSSAKRSKRPFLHPSKIFQFVAILCIALAFVSGLVIRSQTPNAIAQGNGAPIGISDGSIVFDTARPDRDQKTDAANKLSKRDSKGATDAWQQAITIDSTDAEALIYKENQRVLDSHQPYYTLVVTAILVKEYVGGGRDLLQGAYIAQKEYNEQQPQGMQVRLLIASVGSDYDTPREVARKIVQRAQKDPTLVGVMGWSTSSSTRAALPILEQAHIPMVSAIASSDELSRKSRYFFRVAPTDSEQGQVGAQYAQRVLHAKRVTLFYDPQDAYSESLALAFRRNFQDREHTILPIQYTKEQSLDLSTKVQKALSQQPDLIYFAGYVSDASVLLKNLPLCNSAKCLLVMGGDAMYVQGNYSLDTFKSYGRLRFTAFAFPDLWRMQGRPEPRFFQEYAKTFDPNEQYRKDTYGYNRADGDAILAYDATEALLHASTLLLSNGKRSFSAQDLRQALTQLTGTLAFQGVSGTIDFGSDGNVQGKPVLVLSGNADGSTTCQQVNGNVQAG